MTKLGTVKCRICDGAGVLATCACHPNSPRCTHREGQCETCDGQGEYLLCFECQEAPADERFGSSICEGCSTSCPRCCCGTAQHGVVCEECLAKDETSASHERAHGLCFGGGQ